MLNVFSYVLLIFVGTFSNICLYSQLQTQSQSRYYEPDNRDWRGRSGQLPSVGEDRSWDRIRDNKEAHASNLRPQEINQFNKQDQLSSQFSSKASLQGVIIK